MKPGLAVPFGLFLLAGGSSLRADEFWLSSDIKIDGILISETTSTLSVQVSEAGTIDLAKEQVVRTVLSDEDGRAGLRRKWREAADAVRKEDEAVKAFEEEQKAKGLVLYEGDWLTLAEYDRRLQQEKLSLERERLELEAEQAAEAPVVVEEGAPPALAPVIYGWGPIVPAPAPYRRRFFRRHARRLALEPPASSPAHVGSMYRRLTGPLPYGGFQNLTGPFPYATWSIPASVTGTGNGRR